MRCHLPARDHGVMDPAPAPHMIRINGHLGATVLSAFPAIHRNQVTAAHLDGHYRRARPFRYEKVPLP